MSRRPNLSQLAAVICGALALACIWDRDTLKQEIEGIPQVLDVIVGRFDRNPDLYYEMRLERTAAELAVRPSFLEGYDDAAVACDRLGRSDDAIAWMANKREQLETLDMTDATTREHWYRYHANLGTFFAHRWFRTGKDYQDLEDIERGITHIRKALEINPDAHFGREEYQLKFLEWVASKPHVVEFPDPDISSVSTIPTFLEVGPLDSDRDTVYEFLIYRTRTIGNHAEAVEGIAGLIALGEAWESLDVFYALACALREEGRTSLAYMAQARCVELIDEGHGVLHVDAPSGEQLKHFLLKSISAIHSESLGMLISGQELLLEKEYQSHRVNAGEWHNSREAFMMAKLERGLHPDTHADFWSGYAQVPALEVSDERRLSGEQRTRRTLARIAGVTVLCFALVIVWKVILHRRNARL